MIELFIYQMLATFGIVLFRLLQNLNAANKRYWAMLPTTIMIAVSEVVVIKSITNDSLPIEYLITAMTLGGWCGCVLATKFDGVLKNKIKNKLGEKK